MFGIRASEAFSNPAQDFCPTMEWDVTREIISEKKEAIAITRLAVSTGSLSSLNSRYRMVQVTDVHAGIATSESHLETISNVIRTLEPNLILLTGDYVQVNRKGHSYADDFWLRKSLKLARKKLPDLRSALAIFRGFLNQTAPPDGFIGTFGNHDFKNGCKNIMRATRDLPVRWLENASVLLRIGDVNLRILGVSDFIRGKPDFSTAHRQLQGSWASGLLTPNDSELISRKEFPFNIALCHNPDAIDPVNIENSSLILCGHTHGGQICMPGGFPLLTFTKSRRYISGLFQAENHWVYTSRGVGYGGIPLRLFCRPEIVVVDIN